MAWRSRIGEVPARLHPDDQEWGILMAKKQLLGMHRPVLNPDQAEGDLLSALQRVAPGVIDDLHQTASIAVTQLVRIDPQSRAQLLLKHSICGSAAHHAQLTRLSSPLSGRNHVPAVHGWRR